VLVIILVQWIRHQLSGDKAQAKAVLEDFRISDWNTTIDVTEDEGILPIVAKMLLVSRWIMQNHSKLVYIDVWHRDYCRAQSICPKALDSNAFVQ
jgi:hypothetical protein